MSSIFLPSVSLADIKAAKKSSDPNDLYDLLVQPLHEWLYAKGGFEHIEQLSQGQQLLIAYDYMRMQVGQGGFIQFIHNGYVGLLPDMIEQLYKLRANEMALVLDDVLKVFVLNRELLTKPATVQEFALLYDELKEFEEIDARFSRLDIMTVKVMLEYAAAHLNEFIEQ